MKQADESHMPPQEEVQDLLTAYLDEEARIAHRRALVNAQDDKDGERLTRRQQTRPTCARSWGALALSERQASPER